MTSLTLTGKERSVPSRPLPNPPPRLLLVGGRHRRPYCWSLARPPKDGTRRVHRDMVRGPMLLKSLWAAVQPPHLADAAASTATDAPTMATASPPARRKRRGIRARQGNRYPPPKPPRIAVTAARPSALITATPHVATCRNLSHRPAADTVLIVHSPCNRLHLVIPARWLNGLGLATGCRGVGLLRGRGRQQGWHPRPASVALPPSRGGPDAGMGSFAWRRPTTRHQPAATMGCRWSGGAATALSGDLWLCGA